ncbi:MAG: OmpP1/FadL family transporter [Betaproteobacteria bacterium]
MKLLRLAVAAALALPFYASATVGYFSHGYGLKAKGMGGVGIALPQDAMAPASNPAGLGFVSNRIDFGLDWFRPDRSSEVVGNGAGLNGGNDGNGTKNYLIPEFGLSRSIGQNMALGIVVYGNGGMNTTYNRSPFTAFGGTSPAGVDLIQMFIAPTIAWKPSASHSFGLSLNFAYQRFSADGLNPFAGISSDAANLTNRGDDDSTGWGLKLGWTGKITDALTLGATYQSRTRMSKFDKYKGLFAEQGDFDIPEHYGLGIAFRATPKLTLAGDIQQINYGKVKAVGTPADCLFTGACLLGQSNGGGFGWRNTTVYKFGASYEWSKDLTLRGGYVTLRQPIPANQTFFNILAPGVVEDHLTLGATWGLSPTKELTVGYMHAFRKKVNGSGSIPVGFGGGNANLQMNQNSLGIAVGWKM